MKVVSINGGEPVPAVGTPNDALISCLTEALEMAKSGELQSFIGTGYVVLGSLAWLQHEYVHRHTDGLD